MLSKTLTLLQIFLTCSIFSLEMIPHKALVRLMDECVVRAILIPCSKICRPKHCPVCWHHLYSRPVSHVWRRACKSSTQWQNECSTGIETVIQPRSHYRRYCTYARIYLRNLACLLDHWSRLADEVGISIKYTR
jgi:hypothetical protein